MGTELDRLYAAPLDRFTEVRNEVAQELRDAGDDAASKEVKKLKKPSVAAWAVNQLARETPEDIEQLFEIQARVANAASASELRGVARERREVVSRLVGSARKILDRAGHGAGAATTEKISQTLLAASGDDDRELVTTGRLTRELAGTGMDAFGLAPDEEDATDPQAPSVPLKVQREVERLRRNAERAEQEAAQLAQEANFAAEHAKRTRAAAEEAERVAAEARAAAQEAAAEAGL